MTAKGLATELFGQISQIRCINSHSHVLPEEVRLSQRVDALALFGEVYSKADLIAAGMPAEALEEALNPGLPLAQRWKVFEPYWRSIRLTGYSQCILEGLRGLFGFSELTAATVGPISEAIREACRPGYYHQILGEKCNIALSVVNMEDLAEVDRSLFIPLPRLNRFSSMRKGYLSLQQIQAIERDYDVSIGSLDEHVETIERVCQQWKRAKVAGIKLSHSNHRRMDFRRRSRLDATKVFEQLLRGDRLEHEKERLLEDHLVFECCRAASDVGLAIQFHMGMRASNNRSLEGASPAPMVPLLQAFPNARFDLSHSGYPYLREAAILGKTFANVYLNMSWIHIISPAGVRNGLKEWLGMVPYNKIVAFGDDLQYVENVYGHLKIARQNVAFALAEAIQEGLIPESAALDVARAIFYENPVRLYGLHFLSEQAA